MEMQQQQQCNTGLLYLNEDDYLFSSNTLSSPSSTTSASSSTNYSSSGVFQEFLSSFDVSYQQQQQSDFITSSSDDWSSTSPNQIINIDHHIESDRAASIIVDSSSSSVGDHLLFHSLIDNDQQELLEFDEIDRILHQNRRRSIESSTNCQRRNNHRLSNSRCRREMDNIKSELEENAANNNIDDELIEANDDDQLISSIKTEEYHQQHADNGVLLSEKHHRSKMHTLAVSQQLISEQDPRGFGYVRLSLEEKRTLLAEGYQLPTSLPLTKAECEALKIVRRKIKNKLSAQESRRKRREYVNALESRLNQFHRDNVALRAKMKQLLVNNRSLVAQLNSIKINSGSGKIAIAKVLSIDDQQQQLNVD